MRDSLLSGFGSRVGFEVESVFTSSRILVWNSEDEEIGSLVLVRQVSNVDSSQQSTGLFWNDSECRIDNKCLLKPLSPSHHSHSLPGPNVYLDLKKAGK